MLNRVSILVINGSYNRSGIFGYSVRYGCESGNYIVRPSRNLPRKIIREYQKKMKRRNGSPKLKIIAIKIEAELSLVCLSKTNNNRYTYIDLLI